MISPAARIGVLVVDDEPEVAGYLCEILHDAGYQCTVADSSAAALAALTPEPASAVPAIAIVDLVLGDANGLTIAKELVARAPALHIVLISGYADHMVSNPLPNGRQAGFLNKPFTAAQLLAAVKSFATSGR
jgi:DNA-binding NtrC family response regulator